MEFKQDSDHCVSHIVRYVDTSRHNNQQNKDTILYHCDGLTRIQDKGNTNPTKHAAYATCSPITLFPQPQPFQSPLALHRPKNVRPQVLHLHRLRSLLLRAVRSPSLRRLLPPPLYNPSSRLRKQSRSIHPRCPVAIKTPMSTSSSSLPHYTLSRRVLPPLRGKTVRTSTACGADCQSREGRRDEVACLVCKRRERVWDGGVELGEGEEERYYGTDGIFLGEEEELM